MLSQIIHVLSTKARKRVISHVNMDIVKAKHSDRSLHRDTDGGHSRGERVVQVQIPCSPYMDTNTGLDDIESKKILNLWTASRFNLVGIKKLC